jgi:hypothetical protein
MQLKGVVRFSENVDVTSPYVEYSPGGGANAKPLTAVLSAAGIDASADRELGAFELTDKPSLSYARSCLNNLTWSLRDQSSQSAPPPDWGRTASASRN